MPINTTPLRTNAPKRTAPQRSALLRTLTLVWWCYPWPLASRAGLMPSNSTPLRNDAPKRTAPQLSALLRTFFYSAAILITTKVSLLIRNYHNYPATVRIVPLCYPWSPRGARRVTAYQHHPATKRTAPQSTFIHYSATSQHYSESIIITPGLEALPRNAAHGPHRCERRAKQNGLTGTLIRTMKD